MTWVQRGAVKVWQGMAADDPRHGTVRGYKRHRYLRDDPCLPCLDAWNIDQKRRWRAKRHPCPDCGAPTSGVWCRRCSNDRIAEDRRLRGTG